MAGSKSPRSVSYILLRVFQLILAIADAGMSGYFLFSYITSDDSNLYYKRNAIPDYDYSDGYGTDYNPNDYSDYFSSYPNDYNSSDNYYGVTSSNISIKTFLSLLFAASVISLFTALSSLVTNCLPHKHLIGAHYFFTPWDFFMVILWIVAVALCGKWMSDYHLFSSKIHPFWQLDLLKTIFALGVTLIFVFLATAILGIFLIIRSHNRRHSSTRSAAPEVLPPQPVSQIDQQQLLTSPPVYYEPPKQWPPQHHEVPEGGVYTPGYVQPSSPQHHEVPEGGVYTPGYVQPSSPQSEGFTTTLPTHQSQGSFTPQQQSPYVPPRSPAAPEVYQPPPPPPPLPQNQ